MYARFLKSVSLVLVLAFAALMPDTLSAQAAASAQGPPADPPASRWDIFGGYSYLDPHGTVVTPVGNGNTVPESYLPVNLGFIASVSYFFNRYVGIQGEVGVHEWGVQS